MIWKSCSCRTPNEQEDQHSFRGLWLEMMPFGNNPTHYHNSHYFTRFHYIRQPLYHIKIYIHKFHTFSIFMLFYSWCLWYVMILWFIALIFFVWMYFIPTKEINKMFFMFYFLFLLLINEWSYIMVILFYVNPHIYLGLEV